MPQSLLYQQFQTYLSSGAIYGESALPRGRDVFVTLLSPGGEIGMHRHSYYEIFYVSAGSCTLYFEEEEHLLHAGELWILAPESQHYAVAHEGGYAYLIAVRRSSFRSVFASFLEHRDLVTMFFRATLRPGTRANYLHFDTDAAFEPEDCILSAAAECYRDDGCANARCVSYLTLLLTELQRSCGHSMRFYDPAFGGDAALVLSRIRQQYQTLTLSALAEQFHYSQPHLCTLIKQATGQNYTELIKRLRLSEALECLRGTELKINEIADRVGYNSPDHFSRVFRRSYHMSPQEYRRRCSRRDRIGALG